MCVFLLKLKHARILRLTQRCASSESLLDPEETKGNRASKLKPKSCDVLIEPLLIFKLPSKMSTQWSSSSKNLSGDFERLASLQSLTILFQKCFLCSTKNSVKDQEFEIWFKSIMECIFYLLYTVILRLSAFFIGSITAKIGPKPKWANLKCYV